MPAPLTVTEVNRYLAERIREDTVLQNLWVRGEISNLKAAPSGHCYFSLKDDGGVIACALWRNAAQRLRFQLTSGQKVVARGRLEVYPPRGQYQLIVDQLQPDGLGAIYLELEQAKQRLIADGLTDPARKRPLPVFPTRIAVVTSLSGAAVRDICAVLNRSPGSLEITLVPTLVQGEGAVESAVAALQMANGASNAEVILLARGGGAIEDLWTFNSERLAREVAASRLPVVAGIGHETDVTLVDLVADHRAPTPTAAAERILELRNSLINRAVTAGDRVQRIALNRVTLARRQLDSLHRSIVFTNPNSAVEMRRQRLDEARVTLSHLQERALDRWRHRLALVSGRLEAVSPLATLTRGYAVIERLPDRLTVRSPAHINPGIEVRVRMDHWEFDAVVTNVRPEEREAE